MLGTDVTNLSSARFILAHRISQLLGMGRLSRAGVKGLVLLDFVKAT